MATPPAVIFGPSSRADRWWALLPSTTALHAPTVSDLLTAIERVMAHDEPGRPFAMLLDLYGTREPGTQDGSPVGDSAVERLTARRLPPRPAAP
jgi:hypothetical protein